jgi:hypothetical protein
MGLKFAGGSIEYQSTWPRSKEGEWLTLSLPSCHRREAEVLSACDCSWGCQWPQ